MDQSGTAWSNLELQAGTEQPGTRWKRLITSWNGQKQVGTCWNSLKEVIQAGTSLKWQEYSGIWWNRLNSLDQGGKCARSGTSLFQLVPGYSTLFQLVQAVPFCSGWSILFQAVVPCSNFFRLVLGRSFWFQAVPDSFTFLHFDTVYSTSSTSIHLVHTFPPCNRSLLYESTIDANNEQWTVF